MTKVIVLIFIVFLLFGCEGRECLSESNKRTLDLMLKNLDKNTTYTWGCFFDRYDVNIYGLNSENNVNIFLKNIENVKKLENAHIKINAYKGSPESVCNEKNDGTKSCRIKFAEKPFLKLKIDNIRR